MDQFKPPEYLVLEGNLAENWRRWRQRFELYGKCIDLESKTKQTQVAILLHTLGPDCLDIYNTFTYREAVTLADGIDPVPGEDRDDINIVMTKFEQHFSPLKNVTYERFMFFNRAQKQGEAIDQYVVDLKKMAAKCEFGELKDSLIRDRIVCGI